MTNISVETTFFLSDGLFFLTLTVINSLFIITKKADFLDQKCQGSMQKYTGHHIIKREREDKSLNKNRHTQNPFNLGHSNRLYFPWEKHSKHNSNTWVCLCRCLFYLQRESFMPNLVSGQLCQAVQLGPNNPRSLICQCSPLFVEYTLQKRTSAPTPSLCCDKGAKHRYKPGVKRHSLM